MLTKVTSKKNLSKRCSFWSTNSSFSEYYEIDVDDVIREISGNTDADDKY
jgi:hypothetical protein